MRVLAPIVTAAALLTLAAGSVASTATTITATPKHGHRYSTYVVSFRAPYAASAGTHTQYVIGAVDSGTCTRGISSFGRIKTGPYRAGQTVRFTLRAPKPGWCVGVFHGVAHFESKSGETWRDKRLGRFAFRVLSS